MPFACSTTRICEDLRLSRQTVITARKHLSERKLIAFTEGKSRHLPSNYTLLEWTDNLTVGLTDNLTHGLTQNLTHIKDKDKHQSKDSFIKGRVEIWAAASVYTICSINFMFSKSSRLNTSSAEIAEHFGSSSSTIAQKSRIIKDLLKISNVFDPDFSLKEIADNNPLNHLVIKNGFIFFD